MIMMGLSNTVSTPEKYQHDTPHHPNDWNPELEVLLCCLVIEWCLHTEPDTEYPARDCKYPESSLTHTPPPMDRLQLVDPHDEVGNNIDEEEYREQWLI